MISNDNNFQLRSGYPLYHGIEKCDILTQYIEIIYMSYMKSHPNANPTKVRELISNLANSRFTDIQCVMHNNITHEVLHTSIADVCSWIQQRQPIIAGNGTFTKQHEEYLPPVINFLETLKAIRSEKKAKMYTFDENSIEYTNEYTGQINIKVAMNADYGGSGTVYSPFYSAYIPPATTGSAKNLTTTLICCLEYMSDNMNSWCKLSNINELYDLIFTVLNADKSERDLIDASFDAIDVAKHLLSHVNHPSISDTNNLISFLSALSSQELCQLRLAFDIKFVLTNFLSSDVSIVADYAQSNIEMINTASDSDTISKVGFGKHAPDDIQNIVTKINKIVVDNCVYPYFMNDAENRAFNMQRLIVCTTDTDSLMVHFASYIDAFQTRSSNFKKSCLSAAVLGVRLFVEGVIPACVGYFAKYCNIKDKYYRDKFVFKNEYGFMSMALIKKKMYAASTFVQEGNPRDIHKISVTGLSFKKRDAAEFLEPIMLNLYDKYVLTSPNVEIDKLLDEFYDLRNKIQSEIKDTTKYYKVLSLKDVSAYDQSRTLPAQMRGAIIWNAIKPDEELLPMDRAIVIPLSEKLLKENAENSDILNDILKIIMRNRQGSKSKANEVICLPETYKEIPKWLQPAIDIEYATDQLLTPFKQLFDLFDVNMADTYAGMIPSRMICL